MNTGFSHSPILSAIFDNATKFANKTAIIIDNYAITYSALKDGILRAKAYLLDNEIKKGDNIILSAVKVPEFFYVYFASQLIGSINILIDPTATQDKINFIQSKLKIRLIIDPSHLNINEYKPNHQLFHYLSITDIAEIIFTTGTTGDPKGVCLSHLNINESAKNINHFIGNTSEDTEIIGLPICHSFGLGRIRCGLILGATTVIIKNFADVRRFFKAIESHNATGFSLVPSAWAYIRKISGSRIKKYADQIRFIEIGSAPMSVHDKKDILDFFPKSKICMHYGLTEASRSCFIEFHDSKHLDSIGKPTSETIDIKIFDHNGNEKPVGEIGEICVKGGMVARDYIGASMNQLHHKEYLRTGDCGYLSDEGYIYLVGREKELINVGGKKVSPSEVEDLICSLGVGDCVCVPTQDKILGERVKCYILKDSTDLSFDKIMALLADKIEHYKQPVSYEWIDTIPVTSSGKKQRNKIK